MKGKKKVCGAKNRQGTPCQRSPMPNGRCKLHGGATPSGPDSPHYKHGRYAMAFRGKLAEKFSGAIADEKPLNLLPELAVQRSLLEQWIEKVSAMNDPKIADLRSVSALADDVVRTAAQIVKTRNDTALTVVEIKFFQAGILRLMEKYVPDPDRRRNFVEELRGLIPERVATDEDESVDISAIAEASVHPA